MGGTPLFNFVRITLCIDFNILDKIFITYHAEIYNYGYISVIK